VVELGIERPIAGRNIHSRNEMRVIAFVDTDSDTSVTVAKAILMASIRSWLVIPAVDGQPGDDKECVGVVVLRGL